MTEDGDPVTELSELLRDIGVAPRVRRSRVAPSVLYDSQYHTAVLAYALTEHATHSLDGHLVISSSWLKLLQFVAARPWMLASVQQWAVDRRSRGVFATAMMPRGYLGDRTHDAIVDYLVLGGVLLRQATGLLAAGPQFEFILSLSSDLKRNRLFEPELAVIRAMKKVKPNAVMLGGA